jgi:CheY-like chemotaxis protein
MSLNLIIVEDDEQDFKMFSRILKKCDFPFNITWLKDGQECLDYLEIDENFNLENPRKNIFFLDINLPKIDGLELITKIRGYSSINESYVAMLSGSENEKDMETAKNNGSDSYLVKPMGKEQIAEFNKKLNSIFLALV